MTRVAACANPFRVQRACALEYRLEGTSWAALLERFDRLGRRAAIVGPHGSGKTTFLETLAARLVGAAEPVLLFTNRVDRGRVPVDWQLDTVARPGSNALLLVDGYDLLGPRGRWRIRRRAARCGGLIATAHRPCRLPTLLECRPDAAALHRICDELAPGTVGSDEAAQLFARHGGNLREALRALYDRRAAGR